MWELWRVDAVWGLTGVNPLDPTRLNEEEWGQQSGEDSCYPALGGDEVSWTLQSVYKLSISRDKCSKNTNEIRFHSVNRSFTVCLWIKPNKNNCHLLRQPMKRHVLLCFWLWTGMMDKRLCHWTLTFTSTPRAQLRWSHPPPNLRKVAFLSCAVTPPPHWRTYRTYCTMTTSRFPRFCFHFKFLQL